MFRIKFHNVMYMYTYVCMHAYVCFLQPPPPPPPPRTSSSASITSLKRYIHNLFYWYLLILWEGGAGTNVYPAHNACFPIDHMGHWHRGMPPWFVDTMMPVNHLRYQLVIVASDSIACYILALKALCNMLLSISLNLMISCFSQS